MFLCTRFEYSQLYKCMHCEKQLVLMICMHVTVHFESKYVPKRLFTALGLCLVYSLCCFSFVSSCIVSL